MSRSLKWNSTLKESYYNEKEKLIKIKYQPPSSAMFYKTTFSNILTPYNYICSGLIFYEKSLMSSSFLIKSELEIILEKYVSQPVIFFSLFRSICNHWYSSVAKAAQGGPGCFSRAFSGFQMFSRPVWSVHSSTDDAVICGSAITPDSIPSVP